MSDMEKARWERLEELFGEALARSPDERGEVDELVADDEDLREELTSLLAALPEAEEAIDRLRVRIVGSENDEGSIVRMPPTAYDAPDRWLGRRIGRYRIVAYIGSGGMGLVYRGHDEVLDRPVALKFIAPEVGWSAKARAQFLQEARAAAALDHPNICTVHEIAEDEAGSLFIVMPAYTGETLKERIDRGPVEGREALIVAEGIAQALAAAHAKGIVHGDVKPSNVFLTIDGVVKLLDFGVACVRAASGPHPAPGGTVLYMSPEQRQGRPADTRSDVWMAGATIAEMLGPKRSTADGREIESRLREVVARATAESPEDRIADGPGLLREVSEGSGELRGESVVPARWTIGHLSRRGLALGGAAALFLMTLWAVATRPSLGAPGVPLVAHVLWVDDNPENNRSAVELLTGLGVEVTLARSTEEGLALFDPATMGLVVSDMGRYEGPDGVYVGHAGFDLMDGLRGRDAEVPVVFCTSFRSAEENRQEARSRGALDVLTDCDRVSDLVLSDAIGETIR